MKYLESYIVQFHSLFKALCNSLMFMDGVGLVHVMNRPDNIQTIMITHHGRTMLNIFKCLTNLGKFVLNVIPEDTELLFDSKNCILQDYLCIIEMPDLLTSPGLITYDSYIDNEVCILNVIVFDVNNYIYNN